MILLNPIMSLLERFKTLTTSTPLRALVSFILVALLIPVALLASTQHWDLRRKAAESTTNIAITTDELLQRTKAYNLAAPMDKSKILNKLTNMAFQRKAQLLQEIADNPKTFLGHTLPSDVRDQLPKELYERGLVERDVQVEGKLDILHFDDFENERSWIVYKVGDYNLHFTKTPPDIPSGSTVVAQGIALDSEFVLDSEKALNFESLTAEPPRTTGNFRMAILMFNFSRYRRKPFTKEEVAEIAFTNSESVRAFYEESSYNQTHFSGDVFGWYELDRTFDNCDTFFRTWAEDVRNLAAADGVNLDNYDRIAYLFPFIGYCSFGGIAESGGGDEIWVNGMNMGSIPDSSTFIHELGHTFGLGHSNLIKCGNNAIDDYANCQVKEYWDRYDKMGSQRHHFNAAHKTKLAWIPQSRIQDVTISGKYKLYPLETVGAGPQALRIRKPNTNQYYYLEYRKPIGFDAYLPEKIADNALIHIWRSSYPIIKGLPGTFLVDTTPETEHETDEALTDGASFYDEINNITITQLGRGLDYLDISVSLPPSPECSDGGAGPYSGAGKTSYFDGYSDAEISSPNSLLGKNDEDFTIEVWVNLEPGEDVFEYLFARESLETSRQTYRLLFYLSSQNQAANLRFIFGTVTARGGLAQSDYSIPFGKWTHVAAVKEGSILKIFINGRLAGSASFVGIDDNENGVNWIGGLSDPYQVVPHYAFRGFVDDLRISNVARNIEENWMNGIYSKPLAVDGNTLALWKLEGDFEDASPNGNSGTELGDVLFVGCGGCVPESLLPGDLDCDCDVDIVDIMMVAAILDTKEGDDKFRFRI